MCQAIEIGHQGRVTAPPNPWVGCVIVKNGKVIGEGFHRTAGEPHAEVHALKQAGAEAAGATAYVTLEPCSHFGRTPPCTNALIQAKIARVVVAIEDPDERVSGKGIALLREAGIEVDVGIAEEEAKRSLAPYLFQRKKGLPYCILKAAITIDGCMAASDRTSQWITGPEARQNAHQLRAESQAIAIGAGTATADHPALTVRESKIIPLIPPLRVLFDRSGKVNVQGSLFNNKLGPLIIFTTEKGLQIKETQWKEVGAEIHVVDSLLQALQILGKQGILQLLVEGGPTLLSSFWKENLAQELVVYTGPRLLGSEGIPLFNTLSIKTIDKSPVLKLISTQQLGNTVKSCYQVNESF